MQAVLDDYRSAPLEPRDRALLDYAVKLTETPSRMGRPDIEALRTAGFDDTAIHDAAQVTALFAYYNRLADGLGIANEPDWESEEEGHPAVQR